LQTFGRWDSDTVLFSERLAELTVHLQAIHERAAADDEFAFFTQRVRDVTVIGTVEEIDRSPVLLAERFPLCTTLRARYDILAEVLRVRLGNVHENVGALVEQSASPRNGSAFFGPIRDAH
jgi:hypothetical protein